MNVACPSCQTLFEADDALADGPGLPLCDACSKSVRAPQPPPAPLAMGAPPPNRRRPRAPEVSFAPRNAEAPEPPEPPAALPAVVLPAAAQPRASITSERFSFG